MKHLTIITAALWVLAAASSAAAGSIVFSSGSADKGGIFGAFTGADPGLDPAVTDLYEKNQFNIDGDLYIDYSVWGDTGTIDPGDRQFSFAGNTLYIGYSPGVTDPGGLGLNVVNITAQPQVMTASGDHLFFSSAPIISSDFIATGNLYIGDFSGMVPVPLPSAFLFLFSGLVMLLRPLRKTVNK